MNATYEWLYDNYAEPQVKEIFAGETEALEKLIQTIQVPVGDQIRLADTVVNLHLRWGAEVFALGVQMGARLAVPVDRAASL